MAGRPKGSPKTGGRRKGTPNIATAASKAAMLEAERKITKQLTAAQIENITPKEVLLRIMRSAIASGHFPLALAAAEKAAPYCHPRLQNVTMDATLRKKAADFSDEELAAIATGATGDDGDTTLN